MSSFESKPQTQYPEISGLTHQYKDQKFSVAGRSTWANKPETQHPLTSRQSTLENKIKTVDTIFSSILDIANLILCPNLLENYIRDSILQLQTSLKKYDPVVIPLHNCIHRDGLEK